MSKNRQNKPDAIDVPADEPSLDNPVNAEATPAPSLEERIRARAYELFEARGGNHGEDHSDWLQAEQEILGESETE